ncbi:MAG: tRNA 4-thiouridine(8) synthase ThiI [Clostridia bacterium]|nr:tRNA 4-thiouridine(8) synthase ThiI [Clostridia bacterium]
MYDEVLLLKLGEVVLKGLNRRRLEDLLVKNVRTALRGCGPVEVRESQSTVFVEFDQENPDVDAAVQAAKKVFGVLNLCRAYRGSYDWETLKRQTADYVAPQLNRAKTFKVDARRSDKKYPLDTPKICMLMGEHLLNEFPHLTVDVKNPQVVVTIEIRDGNAYVHTAPEKAAGGLPAGTGGHGMLMLSGGIDSPVAGYVMAKRGLKLSAVHFESPPYTSERAKEKVLTLAKKMSVYTGPVHLWIVPFTQIQEEIRDRCREDLFTVIMRRVMLKIACKLAREQNAGCIITGESLGQVASQTLGAIQCTDEAADLPVFRPFIGTDKQEIVDIARDIDTYDTSILPYEDCCTVFTPKHPKTNPKLEEVLKEESKLDLDALTKDLAFEFIRVKPWDN